MKLICFCPSPQRLEVLHGDTGGAAELWVVLYWTVPVPHDQVTSELCVYFSYFIRLICSYMSL